ncbi:MAG: L,D-transpeptidase [Roseofilum sp. SBFL]|uniref:L,D-transpeptidase family protein n=1 Tax=unclassified Roseofilum TaxID=2620099 RepID=UPI001B001025|nr:MULTISPECIES: L,D-transpeptidase [unclassified Roseofilum]MBP0014207.1 L,D-transpeptidase [Roseofilum sp. SID3]MBP0023559.1 L,D-transpeptidase [Roseofilum sp. SID2]MBP0038373.1 L,D-transpeptidase [Roseofilum sp. SID1]MBP0043927.1 L,D-transpeptidase [Roseofilum sp. SBFL]
MIDNRIKKANKKAMGWLVFLLLSGSIVCFLLIKRGYLFPLNNLWGILANVEHSQPLHSTPDYSQLLNYNRTIFDILNTGTIDTSKTSILIEKSQGTLTLYYDRQPIKSYPVVLGGNPTGDKLREGDLKTPEGIFKVRDLYPHSDWSKFIWLDYPNANSWRKHLQAKQQGLIPVSATIGGEIGIHGVPSGRDDLIDRKNNWTLGCISLKNKDVDELYRAIQPGTTVEVIQ